jgi:hypothetical protein
MKRKMSTKLVAFITLVMLAIPCLSLTAFGWGATARFNQNVDSKNVQYKVSWTKYSCMYYLVKYEVVGTGKFSKPVQVTGSRNYWYKTLPKGKNYHFVIEAYNSQRGRIASMSATTNMKWF